MSDTDTVLARALRRSKRGASSLAQSVLDQVGLGPRKDVPGIPEPVAETKALHATVVALKVVAETLMRQRGEIPEDSALRGSDFEAIVKFLDGRYVSVGGQDVRIISFGAVITDDAGNGTVEGDLDATDFTGHEYAEGTALRIASNNIVTFRHKNNAYLWVGPTNRTVGVGGTYNPASSIDLAGIGTADHNLLTNRQALDSHPQGAVTDLVADQVVQDQNLIDHKEAFDPHPQYIMPDELPRTFVGYLSVIMNGDDRSLLPNPPTQPVQTVSDTFVIGDTLVGRFSAPPNEEDSIYEDLECSCNLIVGVDGPIVEAYPVLILNKLSGGEVELGRTTAQGVTGIPDTLQFTIPIGGPVNAEVGDWISLEVYADASGLTGERTVNIFTDGNGASRILINLPPPQFRRIGIEQDIQNARLSAIEDKPYTFFLAGYVPNQSVVAGAMVNDDDWLMHANKDTVERAAPQPAGDPSYDLPAAPSFFTPSFAGVVWSGTEYTFTQSGWINILDVWAPELTNDTSYRILLINNTDPANQIVQQISEPVLIEGDWTVLARDPSPVALGTVLLVVLDALNSGADTTIAGGWDRAANSNIITADPGIGSWGTAVNNSSLRISKTDLDTTDRSTELLSMVAGTTIVFVNAADNAESMSWTVNGAPVDQGGHVSWDNVTFDGNGASGAAPIGATCQMTAHVPVPSPTEYVQASDYWPTNQPAWANARGLLVQNGVDQPADDHAYGVRIEFQPAYISPDWDFMK